MKIGLIGDAMDIKALLTLLKGHEIFHCLGEELPLEESGEGVKAARLEELAQTPLIFLCAPIYRLRQAARHLGEVLSGRHILVHTTRSLEPTTLKTPSTILAEETSTLRFGFLTGPFDARDVLAGRPSSAVCVSEFEEVFDLVKDALDPEKIRVYRAQNLKSAEFSASYTRVISFLVGVGREVGLGASLEATLVTRGLDEAARLAVYQGGDQRSAWGLAGCANLYLDILKNSQPQPPRDGGDEDIDDMQLGQALARLAESASAKPAEELRDRFPLHTDELFNLVESLAALPGRSGLDLPLLTHAARLIRGELSAAEARSSLLKLPVYFE